jgi:hypothetical protein
MATITPKMPAATNPHGKISLLETVVGSSGGVGLRGFWPIISGVAVGVCWVVGNGVGLGVTVGVGLLVAVGLGVVVVVVEPLDC